MSSDWRLPINEILFGLTFTEQITDDVVEWNAENAVNYKTLGLGPAIYYQAIKDALASGDELDGLRQVPQFTGSELADFLGDLAVRLDSLRPWPEPAFRPLDPQVWEQLETVKTVAQLDVPIIYLTSRVRSPFRSAGEGYPGKYVAVLGLRTGETVALLGSYERGEKVQLLAQADVDADLVVDHFIEATSLPANKIHRAPSD